MAHANGYITTMPPHRCVVCRHKDRDAIDRDLIQKRRTQADIARQLDVNRSTISRHYNDHVLPALASAMISSPGDVSIGTMITEFDELYGSNRQIREMAFARDDLRLAKDVNVEQRKLLEVLLKQGDKIGTGSVSDAIGIDRAQWAKLEREISARYAKQARQYAVNFANSIVTLAEVPENLRDKISEIVLRAEFPDEGPVVADGPLPEVAGGDTADNKTDQPEDGDS